MTTQQNDSPVEAMSLQEFIRRAIEEAQANGVYVQQRINAVTSPWLFPHAIGNSKGALINNEDLLRKVRDWVLLRRPYRTQYVECPIDQVFAVAANVKRQSISVKVEWPVDESTYGTSISYPLCNPVW